MKISFGHVFEMWQKILSTYVHIGRIHNLIDHDSYGFVRLASLG